MPGRLKEFYNRKEEDLNRRRAQIPKVDYQAEGSTYREVFDHLTKHSELEYERNDVRSSIVELLDNNATDEQLDAIYDKIKTEEMDDRYTKARFRNSIRGHEGGTNYAFLFHQNSDVILDAFEEVIGSEKVGQLENRPPAYAPTDPRYTGPKSVNEMKDRLNEIEQQAVSEAEDEGKRQEIHDLMQRASTALEDVHPDVLRYYNKAYGSSVPGADTTLQEVLNRMPSVKIRDGLNTLAGGKFKDTLKPGTMNDGAPNYEPTVLNQVVRDLTPEEQQELQNISNDRESGVSDETVDALKELQNQFSQLDYSGVTENQSMKQLDYPPVKHPDAEKLSYANELGRKYYSFWPLAEAKIRLREAVRNGDLEGIRNWTDEYEKRDQIFQNMMGTVKSDKLSQEAMFSANLDSTRSSTRLMPEKYATDYIGHNKLNSLYEAYGFSRNFGISMEEMAKDPYGVPIKAVKQYLEANGTDSRPDSIGAALALNLKRASRDQPTGDGLLNYYTGSLLPQLGRGQEGILSLEKDPAKRNQYLTLTHLGMREAQKDIQRESELQNAVFRAFHSTVRVFGETQEAAEKRRTEGAEKRTMIYANAALLPESGPDRFSMKKIAESLAKNPPHENEWRQDLSVDDYLTGKKPVDYAALAKRNEKLLQDMEAEQKASGAFNSRFNRDDYLRCAFNCHSRLLQNAPAEVRNTQGFKDFENSVKNMYQLAESEDTRAMLKYGASVIGQEHLMDYLKTGKQDQLSTKDSTEYTKMKTSINDVREQLEGMRAMDVKTFSAAKKNRFPERLQQAADDSMNYFRLKVDNGKKTSFHYESGKQRALEGLRAVKSLRAAQDALGLRSPAQKMYEDAELELMLHRHDDVWLGKNAPKLTAQMLYAKKYLDSGIPAEEQKALFEKNAEAGVQRLMNSEAIQMHVRDGSINRLAKSALDNAHPFKGYVQSTAKEFGRQYEEKARPVRLKKAQRDRKELFAADIAAEELKLGGTNIGRSKKNRRFTDRINEVMKRPGFKETMSRVLAGKTEDQLRNPGQNDTAAERIKAYRTMEQSLKYEKRCAHAAAEAMLKNELNRAPSAEQLDRAEKQLRNDARFQDYCKKALSGKGPEEIEKMNEDLSRKPVKEQTVQGICSNFVQAPKLVQEAEPEVNRPELQKKPEAAGVMPG